MYDKTCSIQLLGETIYLEIESVEHKEYQSIYKVRNDSQNFLPKRLVIKPRPRDPDAHCTFAMEANVYSRLPKLQGQLIPRFYGEAKFSDAETTVDAHVIEQVDGTPLTDYTGDILDCKAKIFRAYEQLSQHGVIHGDVELRHIFIVGPQKTLTLIDFGLAEVCEVGEEAEMQNKIDVNGLFETLELYRGLKSDFSMNKLNNPTAPAWLEGYSSCRGLTG